MDALACLRMQMEWGADEALADAPVDRLGAPIPTTVVPAFVAQPQPTLAPGDALRTPAAPPPRGLPALPMLRPAGTLAAQAAAVAAAAETVEALRDALAGFDACPLHATATNLVFADGNPDSRLMLVGEVPADEEDRAGTPFLGPAGRLLDAMLASIGLDRTHILLTTLIPWRPPGNRPPTPGETLACLPFLLRHIALVRPARLVLMGAMTMKMVTGRRETLRRLRGSWLDLPVDGLDAPVPTLPMLHPAFLLQKPAAKREAWMDWLLLRRALDADRRGANMQADAITQADSITQT